jgi:hypothetical protein
LSAASGPATESTHPQAQLAQQGQGAIFHAGTEGIAPIGYQWRFQNVALAGQTNESLVLSNVQPADEGDYSVAISDGSGQRVSNPAYPLVLAPPQIVVHRPGGPTWWAAGPAWPWEWMARRRSHIGGGETGRKYPEPTIRP